MSAFAFGRYWKFITGGCHFKNNKVICRWRGIAMGPRILSLYLVPFKFLKMWYRGVLSEVKIPAQTMVEPQPLEITSWKQFRWCRSSLHLQTLRHLSEWLRVNLLSSHKRTIAHWTRFQQECWVEKARRAVLWAAECFGRSAGMWEWSCAWRSHFLTVWLLMLMLVGPRPALWCAVQWCFLTNRPDRRWYSQPLNLAIWSSRPKSVLDSSSGQPSSLQPPNNWGGHLKSASNSWKGGAISKPGNGSSTFERAKRSSPDHVAAVNHGCKTRAYKALKWVEIQS